MNQWINYHHLFYFKTIAESGSVSKAASLLGLGQPTLSAQLKQFENTLGVKLFERQHKKLILTEQGDVALEYARNIFKMGNEMYEALHDRLKPSKIHLQLGALDGIPKHIVLHLTQLAYTVAPCSITLSEGKFDDLIRDVAAHRVDLAITNFPAPPEVAKLLIQKSILKQKIAIYGSPKFKDLKLNFPQSLKGQKFVLPTYDSQLRFGIEHWLQSKNIEVDIIAETQDTALKKLMATTGMALIPAAEHTVQTHLNEKELIEIGHLSGVYEELFLISSKRKIENPIAAALMEEFSDHLKEVGKRPKK